MEKKVKYAVVCRETGDVIDVFDTMDEARNELAEFEERDKRDGIYEEDFYEAVEVEFKS